MSHSKRHSFSYSNERRRASVVIGSVGRGGIFTPSDFIGKVSANAVAIASGSAADVEQQQHQEASPLISPVTSAGRLKHRDAVLVNEEAQLLSENGIPISYHSAHQVQQPPLLAASVSDSDADEDTRGDIEETWNEAIENNKLTHSTTALELKSLIFSSIPLIVTFVFENSLSVASVFSVGHLGSRELAAVSLGAMSANITIYSVVQGLATSLDTLCSQAYGAGNYRLVGFHFQKCTLAICFVLVPVLVFYWTLGDWFLSKIIPDLESAYLASNYLKVVSLGVPGYIFFETGKRFLQSQGIFHASTYILCVCAPLNGLMNYLFVWNKYIGIGYLGAPIAVAINYWLMALGLLAYTLYTNNSINPMKCWSPINWARCFQGWGLMFKLALPGVIMIEAEFLAFEVLTLLSSYLGTEYLAAQSIVTTMASLTYQVPFAISIASGTRVANLLGASLKDAALLHCKITFVFSFSISLINFALLFFGDEMIAQFFTNDETVIKIVGTIIPFVAVIQIFDSLNAVSAGLLRGQGLQTIGGIVNLVSYYVIGLPVAITLTFKFNFGLQGLWIGTGLALLLIGFIQSYYVIYADFEQLVVDAELRNNE